MRKIATAAAFAALCGWYAMPAAADDNLSITITNDNTDTVIVTVYDMTTHPRSKLLSQRINGFASIPLSVGIDDSGTAHVYWTAITADPDSRKCGRKDKPNLAPDASVHVYAKSECAGH